MMTPYEQLKAKFTLPNAYNDWKEYREFITDLVIGYGQGAESLAIIGAGRCNDIDLKRICPLFHDITLVDVDTDSMKAAIFNAPERVHLKQVSLTGMCENDTAQVCESLLSSVRESGRRITGDVYTDILLRALADIRCKRLPPEELSKQLGKYNLILCNGVLSQLFSMLSYFVRSLTASVSDATGTDMTDVQRTVDEKFREMNDFSIPAICHAIRASADRYAIFGNEYSESSPVEGSHQCIMANRESGSVQKEIPAKWNFNPAGNVVYDMLIQVCHK